MIQVYKFLNTQSHHMFVISSPELRAALGNHDETLDAVCMDETRDALCMDETHDVQDEALRAGLSG